MSTRVLYSPPEAAHTLAALSYEELGRVDNGVWIACPDATVRALAEEFQPQFLYFDWPAYAAAIHGLPGPKVQEVIRKRRDKWAPDALSHALQRLMDLEAAHLESLLRVNVWQPQGPPGPAVDRSLAALVRLAGLERYALVPARAMAVTIIEGESLLLAVLRSALKSGLFHGTDDGAQLAKHADRRSDWAGWIGQAAAELGAEEFRQGLAFADASRAFYLQPASEALEASLQQQGEPALRHGDGVVFVSSERHLSELTENGAKSTVVYEDPSGFYDGVESLTPAQLQRDIAARLERSPAELRHGRRDQIDHLHLHQLLLKIAFARRPEAQKACLDASFPALFSEELRLLGQSLYSSASCSVRAGLEPGGAKAAAEVEADNTLFLELAECYKPSLAGPLKEVQTLRGGGIQ